VEEAALLGVPSIVVDIGNDLVRLGQKWPTPPEDWTPGDQAKTDQYFAKTKVRVYTPGLSAGRPVLLNVLPDFSNYDPNYDYQSEIDLSVDCLACAIGAKAKGNVEKALLKIAIKNLAPTKNSKIASFIHILDNLPEEALKIHASAQVKAKNLASELKALRYNNPLFNESQAISFDDILIRDDGLTPISVFNLSGLGGLESQSIFVSQLTQAFFKWSQKKPSGTLQGLLVIDEAKDFAPTLKSSPSKGAIIRFASQSRKYGLGIILATQAAKSVDSQIVTNCATQFFGRQSSPTNIATAEEYLGKKGVIAGLSAGHFYLRHFDGGSQELHVSLGLSAHLGPADEKEIIALAKNG
jgi:hypothetical protein